MNQSAEQYQYESLIAARVTKHSVCFTHELETGPTAAGSGVLVRCGGSCGVVTCAHVLWGITRDAVRQPLRRVGISVPAAADTRVQAISLSLMEFAQLPMTEKRNKNDSEAWGAAGPDIGFVLLPPSTASTLASIGSVLDLDAQAGVTESPWAPSARELMYLLTGVTESHIGERVSEHGRPGFPITTTVIPLTMETLDPVDGYYRLRVTPAGRYPDPPSYAGMSGGGVWSVTFGRQDDLLNVQDCRLYGIVYYQTDSDSEVGRRIIGHGPKSIYEKLLPDIRALLAASHR